MTRTRIKFCGFTRIDDARAAAALGIDAIGLVMTRQSKRFVEPAIAREIRDAMPPFVTIVTLFMDDDPQWISEAITRISPQLLQFHGNESAADCAVYGLPYLKAVPMSSEMNLRAAFSRHPKCAGFLLDGHAAGEQGGSGKSFDWSRVPHDMERPIVLAGGLTPDNVAEAIEKTHPYAVDVSSGIEASTGVKNPELMQRFVEAVRRADRGQDIGSKR